jgi:hypothetical protein
MKRPIFEAAHQQVDVAACWIHTKQIRAPEKRILRPDIVVKRVRTGPLIEEPVDDGMVAGPAQAKKNDLKIDRRRDRGMRPLAD